MFLTPLGSAAAASSPGTGSLDNVILVLPSAVYNVADAIVAGVETITVTYDTQAINTFFAGPSTGSAAAPAFRAIATADIQELVQDIVGALIVDSGTVTWTYNDGAGTLSAAAAGGGGGYTDEQVRDVIGAALVAGTGITVTVNDAGDTITVASTITQWTDELVMDAVAAMIGNGTGITWTYNDGANTFVANCTITQYTDEMAQDAIASLLTAGTGITLTYNDGANTLTVASSITQYTDEMAMDVIATMIVAGSGITATYNDAANTLTIAATGGAGAAVGKNAIIGGDFSTNPWAAGTSFVSPANGAVLANRWIYGKYAGAIGHFTITKDTDVPTVAQAGRHVTHSMKLDCTTVDTVAADAYIYVGTNLEGYNWLNLSQRAITLSFWHKHTKTGIYGVSLTNKNLTWTYPASYTQAVTNVWELATINIPALATPTGTWDYTTDLGISIRFFAFMHSNRALVANVWTATTNSVPGWGTFGQVNAMDNVANNMAFALVQLETGSAATEFEQRTIQHEKLLCDRYTDTAGDLLAITLNPAAAYTAENARDDVGAALVGDGISILIDDTANTITVAGRGRKNAIIGGDFITNPWQITTQFTAAANNSVTADMWRYMKNTTVAVHTVHRAADAPTLAQCGRLATHCMNVDCTTIDASIGATDYVYVDNRIEGYNWMPLAQRPITLSFWHKHTKTGIYCVALANGTATYSIVAEYTQAVSDVWEKATITFPASSGTGWDYTNGIGVRVEFTLCCGTTYQTTPLTWQAGYFFGTANQVNACDNVANNFKLALVQLEAGIVATEFEYRTIQEELLLCQRYFWKTYTQGTDVGTAGYTGSMSGISPGASKLGCIGIRYPVVMRAIPSIATYYPGGAGSEAADAQIGTTCSATAPGSVGDATARIDFVAPPASVVGSQICVHMYANAMF